MARLSARERFWRKMLAERARSGDTDGQFCGRRGLCVGTLRAWRYKLAERGLQTTRTHREASDSSEAAAEMRFVPVEVKPGGSGRLVAIQDLAAPEASVQGASGSGVEVLVGGGCVIRVARDFDATTFSRVVAVLEREGRRC